MIIFRTRFVSPFLQIGNLMGRTQIYKDLILYLVLNATFSNISAISWQPVLVVEEAGVPGKNHRPWARNCETLSHVAVSRVHPFL